VPEAKERADWMERQEYKKVEVWKSGELVGRSAHPVREVEVEVEGLPRLRCFDIVELDLERKFIFQVLHATPLTSIMNNAGLLLTNDDPEAEFAETKVEPVFLAHGRSDTIRGNPSFTAIVLVHPEGEFDKATFVKQLPTIYKLFTLTI
jgi:hypothetical protein